MNYWILVATSWRGDGTPRPHRKFLSAVNDGNPLAIVILIVVVISVVGSALYRLNHKR